jgi:hypothetical protein
MFPPVIKLYDRRYWPTWKVMEEWRLFVLCIAIFASPSYCIVMPPFLLLFLPDYCHMIAVPPVLNYWSTPSRG